LLGCALEYDLFPGSSDYPEDEEGEGEADQGTEDKEDSFGTRSPVHFWGIGGSEVTLGLRVRAAPGEEVGEAVAFGMPLVLNGAVNMGGDGGAMVDVAITL